MPLQTFDFSRLVQAQPNDYSGLRDALKNFYGGYEMSQTPMKMQNERQNEMLRNALLGAQGRQVGIQNQYLPEQLRLQNALSGQEYQAGSREQEMAAMKMQQFRDAVERQRARMQSSQGYGQAEEPSIPMRSGYTPSMQGGAPMNMQNRPAMNAEPSQDYQAFADAALIQKMTTGEGPKWYPDKDSGIVTGVAFANGQPVTFSLPVGMGAEEKAYRSTTGSERAKIDASRQNESIDRLSKSREMLQTLDETAQLIQENPESFQAAVGPFSARAREYGLTGTPEQKQLLGSIKALSGDVLAKTLPVLFPGRILATEMDSVRGMKFNEHDQPDIVRGKLSQQLQMVEKLIQREELYNEYREQGLPERKAVEMAIKNTPTDDIRRRSEAKAGITSSRQKIHPQLKDRTLEEMEREYAIRKQQGEGV